MKEDILKAMEQVRDKMDSVTKNAKGYNYKYTDLPHLWDSIEGVVKDAGFTVYNYCDGEFVVTKAVHKSGDIESKLPVSFAKSNNPQELGSAITYFRRYNLMLLFNVIVEDDDAKKSTNAIKKAPQTAPEGDLPF